MATLSTIQSGGDGGGGIKHTWAKFFHGPTEDHPAGASAVTIFPLIGTHFVVAVDPAGTTVDGRVETFLHVGDFRRTVTGGQWDGAWRAVRNNNASKVINAPEPRTNAVAFSFRHDAVRNRHFFILAGGVSTGRVALTDAFVGILEPASSAVDIEAMWQVSWIQILHDTVGDGSSIDPSLTSAGARTAAVPDFSAQNLSPTGGMLVEQVQRYVMSESVKANNSAPVVVPGNDDLFIIKPLGFTDARRKHSCFIVRLRQGSSLSGRAGELNFMYGCDGVVHTGATTSSWPVTEQHGLRVAPLVPGFMVGIETPIDPLTVDTAFTSDRANTWIGQVAIPPFWSPRSLGAADAGGFAVSWTNFGRCEPESPFPRMGAWLMSTGYRLNREANSAFVAVWGGAHVPSNATDKAPKVYVGTFALPRRLGGGAGGTAFERTPTFTWHAQSLKRSDSDNVPGVTFATGCEILGENTYEDRATREMVFRFLTFGGLAPTGSASEAHQRTAVLSFSVPTRLLAPGVGIGAGKPCYIMTPEKLFALRERETQEARTGAVTEAPAPATVAGREVHAAAGAGVVDARVAPRLAVNGGALAGEPPPPSSAGPYLLAGIVAAICVLIVVITVCVAFVLVQRAKAQILRNLVGGAVLASAV
jgi:hypothetical protein